MKLKEDLFHSIPFRNLSENLVEVTTVQSCCTQQLQLQQHSCDRPQPHLWSANDCGIINFSLTARSNVKATFTSKLTKTCNTNAILLTELSNEKFKESEFNLGRKQDNSNTMSFKASTQKLSAQFITVHKRRMTNHSRNTLHEIENHRVHNRMQRRITKKRARERTNSNMISPFAEQ